MQVSQWSDRRVCSYAKPGPTPTDAWDVKHRRLSRHRHIRPHRAAFAFSLFLCQHRHGRSLQTGPEGSDTGFPRSARISSSG